MNAVADKLVADDQAPSLQARVHAITKGHIRQWFDVVDGVLSAHRSHFVFREATPAQLAGHKIALKEAIRYGLCINTLIADPDFNEPDLAARLQVRLRQLQDAYDTFHDASLSDEQAEAVLKQVFPE
jgi:hypothetical protein